MRECVVYRWYFTPPGLGQLRRGDGCRTWMNESPGTKHGVWRCLQLHTPRWTGRRALNGRQVRHNGSKSSRTLFPNQSRPPFVLPEGVLLSRSANPRGCRTSPGPSGRHTKLLRPPSLMPSIGGHYLYNNLNKQTSTKQTCPALWVRSGSVLFSLKRKDYLFSLPGWERWHPPVRKRFSPTEKMKEDSCSLLEVRSK